MKKGNGRKPEAPLPATRGGHSRRSFLKGAGAAVGATVLLSDIALAQELAGEKQKSEPEIPGVRVLGRGKRSLTLRVNGKDRKVEVEPRTTLLEAIRTGLGLTGGKEVCGRGTCGACTVMIDGTAVCSCLMLAVDAEGKNITTVEGVAEDAAYAPLIAAFCEHDAAQCGFCIPGQIMAAVPLLEANPEAPEEEVNQALKDTLALLDEAQYGKAVSALLGARKLLFCGVGGILKPLRHFYGRIPAAALADEQFGREIADAQEQLGIERADVGEGARPSRRIIGLEHRKLLGIRRLGKPLRPGADRVLDFQKLAEAVLHGLMHPPVLELQNFVQPHQESQR